MMKERITYFDVAKFALIVLVIYGHVTFIRTSFISANFTGVVSDNVKMLTHLIYTFHMPAFVLISGYFSKVEAKDLFVKKNIKFIYLYIVFHLLNLMIDFFITGNLPTYKSLVKPSFGLWYLPALFVWRWFLLIWNNRYSVWLLFIGSVFVSIISGFVPLGGLFHRILSFMPFFIMGFIWKMRYPSLSSIFNETIFNYALRGVVGLAIFIVAFFMTIKGYLHPFFGTEMNSGIYDLFVRVNQLIMAICLCVAFLFIIPNCKLASVLQMGSNTLFYYIYHPYILFFLSYLSGNLFEVNIVFSIFLTFLTVMILRFLSKIKVLNKIIS